MGARTQVFIKDSGIYLYGHWNSGHIVQDVHRALSKKWRWNDDEYLARIIFDVMKEGNTDQECGFGIGTSLHGDIDNKVTVDCESKTVAFSTDQENSFRVSFEEFVKGHVKGNTFISKE